MSTVVVLDSGPLGLASNPSAREESTRCSFWVRSLIANRIVVTIPEIADYEVRRELIRARKDVGIRRLNELKEVFEFAPISSDVMLLAAEL